MSELPIKQGDYGYFINATIKDANNVVYDLTGYTIYFKVWRPGNKNHVIVSGTCEIVDALSGTCRYLVTQNDFTTSGRYRGEFQLTKAGVVESTQTFDVVVSESA